MKPLLTIGIPTYNRSDHLSDRLIDLEKMGFFNHPEVQIIIHDNDSTKKEHCLKIRNIQKRVTNLELIESAPNIGMVKGCWKIISNAKGNWIALLGDDDPIIMKCSYFLNLIRKNKDSDHLYFRTKVHKEGKISRVSWFPKLKTGNYKTSTLCAKTGFTTHFAFLGSHCFRNKKRMAEIWIQSHNRCMFYGHCVMLLEHYRNSCYTGQTVAAWTSGNERISTQLNILRHLELRNLLKYPPSKAIREFTYQKPWEVVEKGRFPLLDHITHPVVKFINDYEQLPKKFRITLNQVSTVLFNPFHKIVLKGNRKNEKEDVSCIFISDSDDKKTSYQVSIVFSIGPLAETFEIMRIIAKLQLRGPIFSNGTEVSETFLLHGYGRANTMLRKIAILAFNLRSVLLYGFGGLNQRQIVINHFTRPRKGLYKIVNTLEKAIRNAAKTCLSSKTYYQIKKALFRLKHFPRKNKWDMVPVHSEFKN